MNHYVTLNYKSIASMVQIAGLLLIWLQTGFAEFPRLPSITVAAPDFFSPAPLQCDSTPEPRSVVSQMDGRLQHPQSSVSIDGECGSAEGIESTN